MKKSDLKDGMVIECRSGDKGLVLGDKIFFNMEAVYFCDYNDYLECMYPIHRQHSYDIVKVYDDRAEANSLFYLLEKSVNIIWTREEKKIDWSKVPKWTKIEVKGEGDTWYGAYFLGVDNRLEKYLVTFHDEFVFEHGTNDEYLYSVIRLYDEKDLKEEWLK